MSITTDSTRVVSKFPCRTRSASLRQVTDKNHSPSILQSKYRTTENSCCLGKVFFLLNNQLWKWPVSYRILGCDTSCSTIITVDHLLVSYSIYDNHINTEKKIAKIKKTTSFWYPQKELACEEEVQREDTKVFLHNKWTK